MRGIHLADDENLTSSQPTQFENFLFVTIYEQEKERSGFRF